MQNIVLILHVFFCRLQNGIQQTIMTLMKHVNVLFWLS